MANAFAMIDEGIWRRDRDFRRLPRLAQCTFFQVLSQRDVDCAGVLTLHVDLLAKGCDELTADDIWRDLKALEAGRFVYYDTETDELVIRSYIRRIASRSPNMLKGALKAARAVSSPKLRSVLAAELRRLKRVDATECAEDIDAGWKPKGTLSEPFRNPSERGNPSETLSEPPISVSSASRSPSVVGKSGETRASRCAQADDDSATNPRNEPPVNCPEHPGGTTDSCGPCGNLRKAHERWTERERRRESQAVSDAAHEGAALKTQAIANCDLCDDDGYRNGAVCDHVDRDATNAAGIARVRAVLPKAAHK